LKLKLKKIKNKLINAYYIVDHFADKASEKHIFMHSAAISFNILLYVLPALLATIYVAHFFLDFENLGHSAVRAIRDFIPPSKQLTTILAELSDEIFIIADKIILFGPISIAILLWLSSALISSFRTALNSIFNLYPKRIFIIDRLKDVLLIIILTALITVYLYALPLVGFVSEIIISIFPENLRWLIDKLSITTINLFAGLSLFYFIYSYVPFDKLARKIRFSSTIICVLLIEISRYVFAWYWSNLSDYGRFYGAYAVLVAIALWVYYASFIIVFSAFLSKYYFDYRKQRKRAES